MAQVDLHGNIIIDGRTTAGFDSIAGKIRGWAQQIGMVGDKIWDFEEESLGIYRDYETNMLQARAALSSTYDSSYELDKVMESLGEHVQDWAQHSIFHVSDFSGAVNNAAHAGWTLEQQLEGIPRAMLLAQAGGLDLQDGLEYLARALNVTGTDFEDSGVLVDQWVKASHLANLTIEDLGDSLNRMGVTAQLTGSTAELFTMLDALANTGSVGSEAGTLLRGTIMRLIAPTKKAKEAMEELEATADEYSEIAADSEALTEANKLLEAQGFSAFDANGQLKPLMQTYGDLYDALVKIAGSEDDLLTNDEVARILAAIFPQRQISGALSFLQAVKGGWEDLFEAILDSEGTAAADAETMMSGLMGAEELFKSKWEEFQRKVGEELSSPFEEVLGFLGGVVDGLNSMDTVALDTLLGGLTGIAALGSSLGAGSAIFKFFSMLGPWGTAAFVAAFGIGALATYLSKMAEVKFESKFGDMALDIEALKDSLTTFETPGDDGRKEVEKWTEDVNAITEAYSGLAEAFAQELKLDTLTNAELTPEDIGKLQKLGASMQGEVLKGIGKASERDQLFVNTLFGLQSDADYNNLSEADKDLYDALSNSFSDYYSDLEGEAYQIGENIRLKLTEALTNGELTAEDEAAIKAQIERYNQIMAEIADAQRQEDLKTQMNKAQRISWDSFDEWMADLENNHAAALEERQDYWDREQAKLDVQYEKGYLKGYWSQDENRWVSAAEAYQRASDLNAENRQADLDWTDEYYADLARKSVDSTMYDSDAKDAWAFIKQQFADGITDISEIDWSQYSRDELDSLFRSFYTSNDIVGAMLGKLSPYEGDEAVDETTALLRAMWGVPEAIQRELSERPTDETVIQQQEIAEKPVEQVTAKDQEALERRFMDLDDEIQRVGWQHADDLIKQWEYVNDQLDVSEGAEINWRQLPESDLPDWYKEYRAAQAEAELPDHVREQRDAAADALERAGTITDYNASYAAQGGEVDAGLLEYQQNAEAEAVQAIAALGTSLSMLRIGQGPLQAPNATQWAGQQLTEQGVSVQVDGDTTELAATIDAEEGQTLMEYVSGDASDLHMSIYDEDGQTLVENVTGDPSQLASTISQFNGKTVTIFLKGTKLFAEGGRTTEPAIFGEVPGQAEWAIPEEHSERTAQLLGAAAQASGFTWNDILGRFGGLNADPNHINVNVSFAPTVNATNAEGVDAVLERNKAQLEALVRDAVQRALANSRLHDDVEVYA